MENRETIIDFESQDDIRLNHSNIPPGLNCELIEDANMTFYPIAYSNIPRTADFRPAQPIISHGAPSNPNPYMIQSTSSVPISVPNLARIHETTSHIAPHITVRPRGAILSMTLETISIV